jgi:hypothetical protein
MDLSSRERCVLAGLWLPHAAACIAMRMAILVPFWLNQAFKYVHEHVLQAMMHRHCKKQ